MKKLTKEEKIFCDECGKEVKPTPFSPLRENTVGHMVCVKCDKLKNKYK